MRGRRKGDAQGEGAVIAAGSRALLLGEAVRRHKMRQGTERESEADRKLD